MGVVFKGLRTACGSDTDQVFQKTTNKQFKLTCSSSRKPEEKIRRGDGGWYFSAEDFSFLGFHDHTFFNSYL
jgi:hypothetical protein